MKDYLIGVDQKIPDLLIKNVFLGEVETVIRSSIISKFGIIGFSTSDAKLGLCFLILTCVIFRQKSNSKYLRGKLKEQYTGR